VFFKTTVLCNFFLGAFGIGLAFLQRRRRPVYFWLMLGSGMLLCVPLVQYFVGQLLGILRTGLYRDYSDLTLLPTAYLIVWGRWVAYALLLKGVVDVVARRLEPAMTEGMMLAVAKFKASPGALAVLGTRSPGPSTPQPAGMVEFRDVSSLRANSIGELLDAGSFAPTIGGPPAARQWQEELRRVGRDVDGRRIPRDFGAFVTYLGDKPIGTGVPHLTESTDLGLIGFNCIIPEYRCRGYGRMQVEEIVRRLRACGVERVEATTSLHPLFLPARRMYVACGFKESRTRPTGCSGQYPLIDYGRAIPTSQLGGVCTDRRPAPR